jgi:hypothetical protein
MESTDEHEPKPRVTAAGKKSPKGRK